MTLVSSVDLPTEGKPTRPTRASPTAAVVAAVAAAAATLDRQLVGGTRGDEQYAHTRRARTFLHFEAGAGSAAAAAPRGLQQLSPQLG